MSRLDAITPTTIPTARPAPQSAVQSGSQPTPQEDERGFFDKLWGEEGFSFGALLDIINPLQHIPVVGTVYRAITGDTIGAAPRIAGGTLFGGVIGLVASVVDTAVEAETGKDVTGNLLAFAEEHGEPLPPWRDEGDNILFAGDFSPKPDAQSGPGETMIAAATANQISGQTAQAAAVMAVPHPVRPIQAAKTQPIHAPTPVAARPAAQVQSAQAAIARTQAAQTQAAQAQTISTQDTTTIAPAEIVPGQATPAYFKAMPHILAGQGNPREAANGAGGRFVPLTTSARVGRTPINIPLPQTVAADPALLRQMQTGQVPPDQASADKAPTNKATAPASTTSARAAAGQTVPTFLDYTPRNAALMAADAEVRSSEKVKQAGANEAAPPADSIPSVPPDLIMRMNTALQKYQTMQRGAPAPSVNVSR